MDPSSSRSPSFIGSPSNLSSPWNNIDLGPITPPANQLRGSSAFDRPQLDSTSSGSDKDSQEWIMNRFLDTLSGTGSAGELDAFRGNASIKTSHLNLSSSWPKPDNFINPFSLTSGLQSVDNFNHIINNSNNSNSHHHMSNTNQTFGQPLTPLKDDYFWRQSFNQISRSMPMNPPLHQQNQQSPPTPLLPNINSINHFRGKSNYRSNLTSTQDMLLAQFVGLYLDNQQQSSSSDHLNSLNSLSSSSSPSHKSYKLIEPIGSSINNKTNNPHNLTDHSNSNHPGSTRKLKARPEAGSPVNQQTSSSPNYLAALSSTNLISNYPQAGSGSSRRKNRRGSCIECVFCKNNGKPASFYQSHVLKDPIGRVICPVLSAYDCPICHNGGGFYAHTLRYCPQNKPSNRIRNALLKSHLTPSASATATATATQSANNQSQI